MLNAANLLSLTKDDPVLPLKATEVRAVLDEFGPRDPDRREEWWDLIYEVDAFRRESIRKRRKGRRPED